MKTFYVVATQKIDEKNNSKVFSTTSVKKYANCVIANDAAKKLDFLILVIETLQINATESFLMKANFLVEVFLL